MADALIPAFQLTLAGSKHQARVFSGNYKRSKIILILPQTYMNLSGQSLISAAQYYKIPLTDCMVIYDDIDIDFGRLLMKPRGSAGTHNGMKSIVSESGTTDFPRLRVGVGPKPTNCNLSDFVLGKFTNEEEPLIPQIQAQCVKAIDTWIHSTLERAMLIANTEAQKQQ